jgi:hypothetical protein
VQVRFTDRDDPNATRPVFFVEIAEKPLINLFWAGTAIMVFGGLVVLRKRVRQSGELQESPPSVREAAQPDLSVVDSGSISHPAGRSVP